MRIEQRFQVDFSFDVHFTRDVFASDNEVLATVLRPPGDDRPARALVVIDDGVATADPDLVQRITTWFACRDHRRVQLAALPQVLPGGERIKNDLAVIDRLGRLASEVGLCRHSYLIAIGGGALLDAAGLAASLIHRGVRLVRLPTTVLAQNDAGLGVKNGVNRFGAKNFYGCFAPPHAVINDSRFLRHLDDRSWRAGIAEAFKVAIIKDAAFLERLHRDAPRYAARDAAAMEALVRRCAELHLDHIAHAGDPFESGSSRPLDFGHWSAHRLESLSDHRLLHGEAVAIGVAIDCCYAADEGRIAGHEAEHIVASLATCGFQLWDAALELRDPGGRRSVLRGLDQFREHLGGALTLAMPDGLGQRCDIHAYDEARFERALTMLQDFRRRLARSGQPSRSD